MSIDTDCISIVKEINTQTTELQDEDTVKKNLSNRLWKILFSNVNRCIDELYDLCGEEEDKLKCVEAIELLERNSRDFNKLIERIEGQKKFEQLSQIPGHRSSGGISWEVRKPTSAIHATSVSDVIAHLSQVAIHLD